MRLKVILPLLSLLLGLVALYLTAFSQWQQRDLVQTQRLQGQLEKGLTQAAQAQTRFLDALALWGKAAGTGETGIQALFDQADRGGLNPQGLVRLEHWNSAKAKKRTSELGKGFSLKLEPAQAKEQKEFWVITGSVRNQENLVGLETSALFPTSLGDKPRFVTLDLPGQKGSWLAWPTGEAAEETWLLLAFDPREIFGKNLLPLPGGLGYRLSWGEIQLTKEPAGSGEPVKRSQTLETPLAPMELQVTGLQSSASWLGEELELGLLALLLVLTLAVAGGFFRLAQWLEKDQADRDLWRKRAEGYRSTLLEVRTEKGVKEALVKALEEICRYTHWPLAHVTLPDESRQEALANLWYELEPGKHKSFTQAASSRNFQSGESLMDRVLAHEKIVWIEDITHDVSFARTKINYDFGIRTAIGFPVKVGSEIVTVMEFYSDQILTWDQERVDWCEAILAQVASLLETHWATNACQRLEGRFETIFSEAGQPMLLLTGAGMIERVNKAAEKAFGYPAGELRGRSLDLLLGEHDKIKEQLLLALNPGNKLPPERTLKARRKDGQLIESDWGFAEVTAHGPRTLLTRISLEVAPPLPAKTTVAGSLSSGYQTQERLSTEAKLRGDYLSALGLEVQVPAQAVANLSRRLLDEAPGQDRRPWLVTLNLMGERLSRKLTRALELSRVESGGVQMAEHPFDLKRLLSRLLDRFSPAAQEKGVELFVYSNADVPNALVGDPRRLETVLSVLLENGLDYTSKGEVWIEVTAVSQQSGIVELRFTVKDSGQGIGEAKLQALKTLLTQKGKVASKEGAMIALSLKLANGLAEIMGTGIKIVSQLGKGAQFSFTLRCELQPEPQTKGVRLVRDLSGAKILLIVANEAFGQALQKYLLIWGAQPQWLRNPLELQKVISANNLGIRKADLVIFDALAAGSNLEEQVREMRNYTEEVPLVWLSDRQGLPKPPADLVSGWITRLSKPVKPAEFYPILMRLMDRWDDNLAEESAEPQTSVLVVDDKKAEVQLMVSALEEEGYKVRFAQSAQEALEAYKQSGFSLALVDLGLPGTDGVELIRRLRTLEQEQLGYSRPLFALTAPGEGSRNQEAFEAGADNTLAKPVNNGVLIEMIRSTLYL